MLIYQRVIYVNIPSLVLTPHIIHIQHQRTVISRCSITCGQGGTRVDPERKQKSVVMVWLLIINSSSKIISSYGHLWSLYIWNRYVCTYIYIYILASSKIMDKKQQQISSSWLSSWLTQKSLGRSSFSVEVHGRGSRK